MTQAVPEKHIINFFVLNIHLFYQLFILHSIFNKICIGFLNEEKKDWLASRSYCLLHMNFFYKQSLGGFKIMQNTFMIVNKHGLKHEKMQNKGK